MLRKRDTSSEPQNLRNNMVVGSEISFCLIYPRLGAEEVGKPEMRTGEDKNSPNKPVLSGHWTTKRVS